jgi:hypothetical protein
MLMTAILKKRPRRCRRGHVLGPEDPLCETCVEAYLESGRKGERCDD